MLSPIRPDPAAAIPRFAASSEVPGSVLARAQGLGKRFDIYPNDRSRFFEFLGSRMHHTEHWSVRNVNFEARAGHAFGIVGSNGAGKSTLLRLLAGISEPTEGELEVNGRMATLLDLGVGFHPPFSGRENIELGCALAGMTPPEIVEHIPAIIAFAELGEFIDHPVRTYSTGMQLRLGFAIAVHSDAKVLLIDEVLAVGDQYFQRKCVRRIERALADGCSLIFVSHDLHAIRALCSEVLWMDKGEPKMQGGAREVVDEYVGLGRVAIAALGREGPSDPAKPRRVERADPSSGPLRPEAWAPRRRRSDRAPSDTPASTLDPSAAVTQACAVPDAEAAFRASAGEAPRIVDGERTLVAGTGEVRIDSVRILDDTGRERAVLRTGEGLLVAVTFRTTEPVDDPIFGVAIHRDDGVYVYGPNTGFDHVLKGRYHGIYTFYLHYPSIPLLHGNYRVSAAVFDAGHVHAYVWHNELYAFRVEQDIEDHGIVAIPHAWGIVTWHEAPAAGAGGPPDDPE